MPCSNREVLYPIFLECTEWADDDPFWESVFENLAYGKAPHGTYISRGNLCCAHRRNSSSFSYRIENKDSKLVYTEVYDLLSEKAGLVSDAERLRRMAECESVERENDWAAVRRKKNIKELLVEQFVIRKRKEHSLTPKQGEQLLGTINTALTLKSITQKDVHMEDGSIQSIEGIEFSEGAFEMKRNLYDVDVNLSADLVAAPTPLSKLWHKYIEEIRKTVVCRRQHT
jgi:hypothetical protein